jgi:hypothetical protein
MGWPRTDSWRAVPQRRLRASGRGKINDQGYAHANFPYLVSSRKDALLMSPAWLLDNYFVELGKTKPKASSAYKTEYALDINGDGVVDNRPSALLYDLKFKHRQRDGLVVLRTFPISIDQKDRELRVIMQDLVDDVAGAGYEAIRINDEHRRVEEKRDAASIIDRAPATLAGLEAYAATIDVANVDQLKLTPEARRVRVRLVVARTPFRYTPKNISNKASFPVLMLAEYASLPEDYERDLPDFLDLLGRVAVGGVSGFTVSASAPSAATAASALAAPAGATAVAAPAPAATPPAPAPVAPTPTPAAPATH